MGKDLYNSVRSYFSASSKVVSDAMCRHYEEMKKKAME